MRFYSDMAAGCQRALQEAKKGAVQLHTSGRQAACVQTGGGDTRTKGDWAAGPGGHLVGCGQVGGGGVSGVYKYKQ